MVGSTSAVALVALPGNQPALVEPVDEGDGVTPVDAEAVGNVFLAGRSVLIEAAQDGVLVLTQTVPASCSVQSCRSSAASLMRTKLVWFRSAAGSRFFEAVTPKG